MTSEILSLAKRRDGAHCSTEVDGKWWLVQRTQLSDLVCHVDHHMSLLDEWKTENSIDHQMRTSGNKKGRWGSFLGQIGHVDLKGDD